MPLGLNRTDANVPPNTSYRNGTPVTLPKIFGNAVDWQTPNPAEFGNPIPSSGTNENIVDWAPTPTHFGNTVLNGPPPPTGFALVAHAGAYTGGTPVTSAIDTTGAGLLVAIIGTVVTLGTPPITDSKGNTWTLLTIYGPNSSTQPIV
jgi:hypothetical protein